MTVARQVWEQLTAVSRAAKSETGRRLSEYGMHTGQQFVLECLWAEDGLTPSQLAERIGVEAATLTRALRRMETAGLIERRADARDRRRIRTWLTERAKELRGPVSQTMERLQHDSIASMSADEAATLVDLLGRMRRALQDEAD